MIYAKIENGVGVKFPILEKEIRKELMGQSLPAELSNDILEPLGYAMIPEGKVSDFPQVTKDHKAKLSSVQKEADGSWSRTYTLIPVPETEKERRLLIQWKRVRKIRDEKLAAFDWRISRYNREIALGMTPTDDITVLHTYMQALADITNNPDPFLVVFPEEV